MLEALSNLTSSARADIGGIESLERLEELRIDYLGRKGKLTAILRGLGALSPEERPAMGERANQVKREIELWLDERKAMLKQASLQAQLKREAVDVTFPGRKADTGRLHPLTLIWHEIRDIFTGMGFEVAEGPEVESEYYNFEALNIPAAHPSREMWDTFYLNHELMLRTHTSPVQIRVMQNRKPPLRIISAGKCFRRDAVDATHSWMFHQMEGFMVDKGVTFGDLKGVMINFAREIFGSRRKAKFNPSYFPFTEPSAEMSIDCFACEGAGCRVCKKSGWIEILGAGMIHPQVLREVGYDPETLSGFAFGMGLERIAMLKYDIDDIRWFFDNDIRFLKQF